MGIWQYIKELVRKMIPKKSIENVLHINPTVSDRMSDAIQLWADMYEGNSPWLKEPTYDNPSRVVSIGIPALIASEKSRMATLEMKSEVTTPMKSAKKPKVDTNLNTESKPNLGIDDNTAKQEINSPNAFELGEEAKPVGSTERAEFLQKQYKKLLKQIRRQLEYGIAKGGLVIKPYIVMHTSTNSSSSGLVYDKDLDDAEIEFDFIQADRFYPLAFDANGKVVEAAFIQTKVDKANERVYLRIEYHKLSHRTVTVQNLAFESTDMSLANSNNLRTATNLGKQIPLTAVSEWADLQETTVIEGVDRLLFAYFRMPEANTVDPYSPLGVSGYSRVISLIKDADMQYSRLLWEYEGGELAIDVDRDALQFVTDPNGEGRSILPEKQNRLFRKVDLNAEDTYNVFAPQLRDVSLINGLNEICMRIEDATGLSRGTISNVDSMQAKTATELKILKQRSYATNADIQSALQDALEDAIYVSDVYCTLYNVTPPGEYEMSFEWDDSIIVDSESELAKRMSLLQNKVSSRLEVRMWYFGETENQAKLALQQVDTETDCTMLRTAKLSAMQSAMNPNTNEDNRAKSMSTETANKESSAKQADDLDNPDKSETADEVKNNKNEQNT